MTESEIRKGLAGVVADTTAISKVNPETNSLLYPCCTAGTPSKSSPRTAPSRRSPG